MMAISAKPHTCDTCGRLICSCAGPSLVACKYWVNPMDAAIGIDVIARCLRCNHPLRFGSHDPLEGFYYWCSNPGCNDGPYGPYLNRL